ncbi:hypothetical protein TNIN_373111 [Trichonephila inaurata madagascariensis]|uniref:Uncharacterized protein n=1 Tax=Trichonephila inaurata madagascariensis TaxID=2747483 RepID=A0A8X6YCE8_9ARAC|nr:hypothetical protein TNIN_373111 [Trichonephila inaurata madagascariensis]
MTSQIRGLFEPQCSIQEPPRQSALEFTPSGGVETTCQALEYPSQKNEPSYDNEPALVGNEELAVDDGNFVMDAVNAQPELEEEVMDADDALPLLEDIVVADPVDPTLKDNAAVAPVDPVLKDNAAADPVDPVLKDNAAADPVDPVLKDNAAVAPVDPILEEHAAVDHVDPFWRSMLL